MEKDGESIICQSSVWEQEKEDTPGEISGGNGAGSSLDRIRRVVTRLSIQEPDE